ncbi:MAG: sigma-E factor negative regulatory protein, partial [Burkholderiales bacterium]
MERISALMDGELEGQEAQSAMLRLLSEADVRSGWAQYHLISDALHNEYRLSSDFAKQV